MSVLLEMAMFPTNKNEQVVQVIKVIKESGFSYKLSAMATTIETQEISQALSIVQKCYEKLEKLACN